MIMGIASFPRSHDPQTVVNGHHGAVAFPLRLPDIVVVIGRVLSAVDDAATVLATDVSEAVTVDAGESVETPGAMVVPDVASADVPGKSETVVAFCPDGASVVAVAGVLVVTGLRVVAVVAHPERRAATENPTVRHFIMRACICFLPAMEVRNWFGHGGAYRQISALAGFALFRGSNDRAAFRQ